MSKHHQSLGKVTVQINGKFDELSVWATDGIMYFNLEGKIVKIDSWRVAQIVKLMNDGAITAIEQQGSMLLELQDSLDLSSMDVDNHGEA